MAEVIAAFLFGLAAREIFRVGRAAFTLNPRKLTMRAKTRPTAWMRRLSRRLEMRKPYALPPGPPVDAHRGQPFGKNLQA